MDDFQKNLYVESYTASGRQAVKYHALRQIWLQCVPHIQFMTPRTDVCHHCEEYRVLICKAITEDDKLKLAEESKGQLMKHKGASILPRFNEKG